MAWFLFDLVYYGNTISSPIIVKLVAPHATLITQTSYILGYFRRGCPARLWVCHDPPCLLLFVAGATTTVAPFLILFGATYFFSEFWPEQHHLRLPG